MTSDKGLLLINRLTKVNYQDLKINITQLRQRQEKKILKKRKKLDTVVEIETDYSKTTSVCVKVNGVILLLAIIYGFLNLMERFINN